MSGEKKEFQINGNLKIEVTEIDWSKPMVAPLPVLSNLQVNTINAGALTASTIAATSMSLNGGVQPTQGDIIFTNENGTPTSMREVNRRLSAMESRTYNPPPSTEMFTLQETVKKLAARVEELERELADIPKYKSTY